MSVIKTHEVTLYGKTDAYKIVLRPLSDDDLPYLYRWNSDPEVLYWTEGEEGLSYSSDQVEEIYGGISQENLCFAVEADGEVIGECWLQKLNFHQQSSSVREMYDKKLDVRRIDMCIGEKLYWNKGIGTAIVKMLADFAFGVEKVDILHCINEDYNVRSIRAFEKNGFQIVLKEELPKGQLGQFRFHWRLERE